MAIAFDNTGDGVVNTNTQLTYSHTTAGVDRMLFVTVVTGTTAATITSVTYAGAAMTKIDSVINGTQRYIYLFYLINPTLGANNVVVNSSANELIISCSSSYTGVRQYLAPDAHTTNTGNLSPTTTSVTTVADNCWTILVVTTNGGTATASTGSTLRIKDATFNTPTVFDSNAALTPPGSKSMAFTKTGNGNAICMASFAPSLPSGMFNFF